MPSPPPDGHKFVATFEIKGPKTSQKELEAFQDFKRKLNELLKTIGGNLVDVKVVKSD